VSPAFWPSFALIERRPVPYDVDCLRSGRNNRRDRRVDEEALIVWQDVLDMVAAGRPSEVGCPFCNHRPLTIEEVEYSTRISCPKCKKFIEGRFQP
jgi:hypothetical protein